MNSFQSVLGKNSVVWRVAVLAFAGFVVSYASSLFLRLSHQTPPIMPAAAIILTALLSASPGRRWLYLVAAVAGYCAAGYVSANGSLSAVGWVAPIARAVPTVTGVVAVYGLIRRFGAPRLDFARPRDLALFGVSAGLAGPLVTVCVGAVVMHWLHQDYTVMNISRWAAATSLGMLIITPGLLIVRQSITDLTRPPVSKAGLVALGVLVLVSVAAFSQASYDLRYMVPPALALVAIYLEFLGVAVGGLIVAVIAVVGAFLHKGVFAQPISDPALRILLTQLFLGFVMAVNLPFAALLVQRRRMRDTLLHTKLEAEAAQAAVAEQQRRSSMAEEIAKVGFWRADFRTGRVEWSDQNYVIFGRDPSQPLDLGTLDSYVHPEDREGRAGAWSQLRFGEPTMSAWRIVRQDGEIRRVVKRGVPEFDADGSVCGAFGTVVDVTELAQAQEALAQSDAHLRLITQTVADIIVQTDLDGRITFVSPSVEARLGYTPEEVLGATWMNLLHPEDAPMWWAALDLLLQTKGKGAIDSIRCRATAKDGREIWLALRPALILDGKTGEPVGVVDIARDITERNRMFAELQAAQAAAEKASAIKGEFLANMSHEIRTPLTSISGFTKLVESQGDLSEDTRRYVGHIGAAASALVAIVNDVLDLSKLEAGEIRTEPRPTDVQAVMRDTVNLFSGKSQEKGLSLTLDYPLDAPALLMVDPDRLRQVLINLAGNGLKFTEQGGVHLVGAYDAASERLKIEVVDTGPGVPADRMSALFQRFSQIEGPATRKFGGTGLGLAISKGFVEAMGGEIGVTSQEGEGACFWFTIPAVPAQSLSEPALVNADLGPMDGLQVLVVDDNTVNRELVRALLAPLGVAVTEAQDGEEAVERAGLQPFDVILMDLRMPRMNGRQATRAIVESSGPNAATPIIAFSADGADEAVTGDLAALGFAGRLIKPFKPMELILTLVSAIQPADKAPTREVA